MKNYKDFEKAVIGVSDIGRLLIDTPIECFHLPFGGDGVYKAYIVEGENVEIGNHYELIKTCTSWLRIYDEENLTKTFHANKIKLYKCNYTCIIQLIND